MTRRSLLTLTVSALAAFAVLVGLGTWQVQRLHWKEGLIAERRAALEAPPIDLPSTLDAARGLEFRRVRANGTFLHEREITVHGIERQRGAAGYLVVTPFRLEDGRVVLVERGWVPLDKRDPATRSAGNPGGAGAVEGLLRLAPAGKPGWFIPENDAARREWFYIDVAAMARAAGVPDVLPFYLEAGPAPNAGGLPLGGQSATDLPNDHLHYAITWYALAAALAVIYFILLRRERAAARTSENPP
jgi:surfeit locus 1 family protein